MWAIEYGYKPDAEKEDLAKIASRSAEPALRFATDEDARGSRSGVTIDSDPLVNQFDLSSEPLAYVKQRAELISGLWSTVTDKMVKDGEDYHKARQAFGVLLGNYGRAMHFAARYIGGVSVNRSHKGDEKAEDPYVVTDAKQQREAMDLLEKLVFSDKPFQFPPDLYNHLASTRWDHWGVEVPLRSDYPVHEVILMWQENVLDQLMSPFTLERLHDSELKVPDDKDAFTTAELITRLTKSIFSEVDSIGDGEYTNRKPAVSSLRRNLQREYLSRLSKLAMGESKLYVLSGEHSMHDVSAPSDCQTIAFTDLKSLKERMDKLLAGNVKLDDYTKAHFTESSAVIGKVLDAKLDLISP
jgi:Met-zincin